LALLRWRYSVPGGVAFDAVGDACVLGGPSAVYRSGGFF
jgi:hypothetical protein